jgi:hypothetical protein
MGDVREGGRGCEMEDEGRGLDRVEKGGTANDDYL